jgi:hypothetical protein
LERKKNLNLSKSTLIRSLQCQKSLYLYKNFFHLRDPVSPEQQAVFNRGHNIGTRAQKINSFRGGVDVSPPKPWLYARPVKETRNYVTSILPPVIYEAAFRYGTTLVYLDILEPKNNAWYAYEVKSSKRISETYIRDAAIQYYVITKSGLVLNDFRIIYVKEDFDYEACTSLDDVPDDELFRDESVLERILPLQEFVEETIANALATLEGDEVPDICMGQHCDTPYPCDFKGACSRQENHINE